MMKHHFLQHRLISNLQHPSFQCNFVFSKESETVFHHRLTQFADILL